MKKLMEYSQECKKLMSHNRPEIVEVNHESKDTLDYFIEVMKVISKEAKDSPELLRNAPHNTTNSRVDEAKAARNPNLRWSPINNT